MSATPRILIVDDEPRMCESLRSLLLGEHFEVVTVTSGRQALDQLSEGRFDIVLLDIVMPDMDGHEVMDHIDARNSGMIVIVMTGNVTLDSAVRALRKGAYDFLRKPFEFDELLKTIQNALNEKKLESENRVINGKLKVSEERYCYLVQSSPDIIYTLDTEGRFTFVNDAVEQIIGYSSDQLVGKHYAAIIHEADLQKATWAFNERRTGGRATSGAQLRLRMKNSGALVDRPENSCVTIELKATGMYAESDSNKKVFLGTHGVARDISKRKRLEDTLQRMKRMEALSTLGGGIAHDFNNLLMGIQGNVSLLLLDVNAHHPYHPKLKNIEKAVQSGSDLTRQLLGFAKGGKFETRPISLNDVINKSLEMVGRTNKEIRIRKSFKKDLWTAEVDPGQIEQVLINLFLNAYQAMPGGGELLIRTENVLAMDDPKYYRLKPGKYVNLSVTDTGLGMDEATQERIFDPFFTTKGMGRGTGLGLASAYAIIKNHSGIINVHSKKGKGTTFDIYLPASEKEVRAEEKERSELILKGTETVLLIDDEDMILDVGEAMLRKMGYRVLLAKGGKEGVRLYKKHKRDIDLVILDMIMPDMAGGEAYDKIRGIDPKVKVLLSSGYSLEGQAAQILERGCNGFVQKPFDIRKISRKIRDVLNEM